MKLYFTIFPKRTQNEAYFLRDSNVKLNRVNNKEVDLKFDFERSFSTIAQRRGLDKSEVDRVKKIKQRLPQNKHIGVARLSITILKNRQSALCYLFVCEGNVAYLSAPEMVFSGESMCINSTKRCSVYETTYKVTKPDSRHSYVNLRFDSEYKLVTKRRGPSKIKKSSLSVSSDAFLLEEVQTLRKEIKMLKKQYNVT
ncbi:hypothetical protein [Atlantibacter hermannii]|uniref:hypothetical protein n=1 Tax=Atlantibacter hermannii TaxID=565 RepID=UPI0028994423|nr:hypothetical protein [Atlantibacter hermannii]